MAERRTTNQRIKILEHLRMVKTHPNAEMVYQSVKKDLPAISLATVYRNLNLLADEGKIIRLEVNGEYRFDGDMCSHQHFVCAGCGKIHDIFQKEISNYALKKFSIEGLVPSCVSIIFRGHCDNCR